MKINWFPTMAAALSAEAIDAMIAQYGLDHPLPHVGYGETYSFTIRDNTKYGHYVSLYRDERGYYERPVHYKR